MATKKKDQDSAPVGRAAVVGVLIGSYYEAPGRRLECGEFSIREDADANIQILDVDEFGGGTTRRVVLDFSKLYGGDVDPVIVNYATFVEVCGDYPQCEPFIKKQMPFFQHFMGTEDGPSVTGAVFLSALTIPANPPITFDETGGTEGVPPALPAKAVANIYSLLRLRYDKVIAAADVERRRLHKEYEAATQRIDHELDRARRVNNALNFIKKQ